MKQNIKYHTKHYGILFAVIIIPLSILYILTGYYYKHKESVLIQSAYSVCSESALFSQNTVKINGIIHNEIPHPYGTILFSAEYNGRKAFLVSMPVTSIYGIYSALFLYEKTKGGIFCGLMGMENNEKPPEYYGITPEIIAIHSKKIEKLLSKETYTHEK